MIDEDLFPPVASINIAATDLRFVLNAKKDGRFSPNTMVRNVWIPKQYLVHKDDVAAKGRVYVARENENNGRYPYHSKHKINNEKSSKGKNVFPKERHTFFRGKGH